jgi:hypothetical protein
MVEPVSFAKTVCDDPDDDKFLEAALAANAVFAQRSKPQPYARQPRRFHSDSGSEADH